MTEGMRGDVPFSTPESLVGRVKLRASSSELEAKSSVMES